MIRNRNRVKIDQVLLQDNCWRIISHAGLEAFNLKKSKPEIAVRVCKRRITEYGRPPVLQSAAARLDSGSAELEQD
jgi:hypothetical protein